MNCKNIIKELSNYLDEALDPPLKSSIENHLEGCEDCRIVVDTTQEHDSDFLQLGARAAAGRNAGALARRACSNI